MNKALLAIVGITMAVAPAFAINISYDLDNANTQSSKGGSLAFTVSGVSATVTAWSAASSGSAFTTGYVGEYSGNGLGVCNASEGSGCSSPSHQVDNSSGFDFLLFKFNAPVSLDSIYLKNFGGTNDMDLSYWTRTDSSALDLSQASLSASSLTSAGFGSQNNVLFTASGTNPTVTDTLTGNNVTYLLVDAYFGTGDGTADYFKVDALNVHTVAATPEPGTLGTFGLGLAGLGLTVIRRRRRGTS